ncbi:DnaJ-domain-containing protein [Ascobolus immersus RN42]|uniref:DnaJ-domain-containing protein n=1 Tax=Ascobolus immersus RN42 TaxID=1160509 RepID=A0A3N4IC93_ASCIM|nr:DnaJ-domain-containing protein [Ascobolus immersus RN42]
MSTEYNYDDQGQFFPYFVVTMLGLVLVPTTWSTLVAKDTKQKGETLVNTGFRPPRHDLIQAARRKIAKQEKNIKRFFLISAGWALFSYMIYLIVTTENVAGKVWDPYEILNIGRSADEKAIKKHYKKLSLQFHPDKVKATGNETIEDLNERFVQLTKAYKALTDEEIRNNYIQYGHPDGKQSFSIGIALPKWIVAEGNTYYVLAVYGILFGIVLPYTVGKWWYGTRRFTKDGVVTESAGRLFKDYTEETDERKLVETLSLGEEMREAVEKNPNLWSSGQLATIERKIAPVIGEKSLNFLNGQEGWRRKALALLWAYLYRIDLDDKLETVKLEVGTRAVALNKSFFAIALAYGNVLPALSSININQSLIQAVAPGESPLMQLPNFTAEVVKAAETDAGRHHFTIQQFMAIPEDRRKKLLVSSNLLSEGQYDQAMAFAKKLPALTVESAFFKVTGEKVVLPNSLVQFVVKARIVPPGDKPTPVPAKDLLEEDEAEDDVNALIGRSDKKTTPSTIPYAHAPYYPKDHLPQWQLFLGDAKQDKIIIPPTAFTTFDSVTDSGVVTLKLQFQAPPQPGEYTFTMHLHSDSYIGVDTKRNVTMEVSQPQEAAPVEDDEISEPDEDSFAGQMAQMKGEKAGKKRRAHQHDSDDEDDESDTDGKSDEDSDTDTDTDTDEE